MNGAINGTQPAGRHIHRVGTAPHGQQGHGQQGHGQQGHGQQGAGSGWA